MTAELDGRVRHQLAAAAVSQVVVLVILAVGAGARSGRPADRRCLRRHPVRPAFQGVRRSGVGLPARGDRGLGPANLVTLTRAVLVGGVTALVVDRFVAGSSNVRVLVVVATAALLLDAVDGQVARRTNTVTALGARFDMETDAFLVLVLSVYVAPIVGPAALVIGAMRYAYAVAGGLLPWLRAPLPTRYSAKVVAAIQGIVLVLAASGLVPVSTAGRARRRCPGSAGLVLRPRCRLAVAPPTSGHGGRFSTTPGRARASGGGIGRYAPRASPRPGSAPFPSADRAGRSPRARRPGPARPAGRGRAGGRCTCRWRRCWAPHCCWCCRRGSGWSWPRPPARCSAG